MPARSGQQIELRHGDQRAVAVEVGGGLREYSAGGVGIIDGYAEPEPCSDARGQVLIPWPNRLRDGRYEFAGRTHRLATTEPQTTNAIHGLVRTANWTLAGSSGDSATMEHVLEPQLGYPFALALRIEYTLAQRGLSVRTSATNIGDAACPFGAGAHPYVTVGTPTIDSCELRSPGGSWMPTDERAIPVGNEPVAGTAYDFRSARVVGTIALNTAYGELERDDDGLARVVLTAPGGRSVTVWQDERQPYLMLYTGDTLSDPARRRRSVGVEPMTCAPNAFQTGEGLLTLRPGETFTCSWGIEPRG
jgi:aldose 1-epimerase